MLRNQLIYVLLLSVFIAGCANGKRTTKSVDGDQDGIAEQTVSNTDNLSQRTIRYQEKVTMATALCKAGSSDYNEQRIMFYSPEIQVGEVHVKAQPVYNPMVAPFNMTGCIEESMRWGGERIATAVLNKTADLLKFGIIGSAAVDIATAAFENSGVKVSDVAEGATVGVGTDTAPVTIDQRSDRAGDDSTYNTCAGDLVDGECVIPAVAATESGDESDDGNITDEEECLALGGEFVIEESRCSDGMGGTL